MVFPPRLWPNCCIMQLHAIPEKWKEEMTCPSSHGNRAESRIRLFHTIITSGPESCICFCFVLLNELKAHIFFFLHFKKCAEKIFFTHLWFLYVNVISRSLETTFIIQICLPGNHDRLWLLVSEPMRANLNLLLCDVWDGSLHEQEVSLMEFPQSPCTYSIAVL